MPLKQSASKAAFKQNVETEMKANPGKANRAQNLAIAYSVQRKNKKFKGGLIKADAGEPTADSMQYSKGGLVRADAGRPTADSMQYAEGGLVRAGSERPTADSGETHLCTPSCYVPGGHAHDELIRGDAGRPTADSMERTNSYAEGGMVREMPEGEELRAGSTSVYDSLRHRKRFAAGGRVDDLDDSDVEHGNVEDDLSYNALGKKVYDNDQLEGQPDSSNEHGGPAEEDEEDDSIVAKIRKRGLKKIGSGEGTHD